HAPPPPPAFFLAALSTFLAFFSAFLTFFFSSRVTLDLGSGSGARGTPRATRAASSSSLSSAFRFLMVAILSRLVETSDPGPRLDIGLGFEVRHRVGCWELRGAGSVSISFASGFGRVG
ncbi:hypothetical protein QBC33DRAFT_582752, partial [Phialemonium atrogriseum]